jgi:hypothetical protein
MLVLAVALLAAPAGLFANGLGSTVWDLTGFVDANGTFAWAGGNSDPLTGSGIQVSDVTGNGTASHAFPGDPGLPILNGSLTFSTGNYSYLGTAAVNNTLGTGWAFGAGSTAFLDIQGCIAGLTPGQCTGTNGDNNVVLLSDAFQNVRIVPQGSGFDVVFGGIVGTVNPLVAGYFGLGNDVQFATSSFNFTIQSAATPGNAITDVNTSSTSGLSGTISAGAVPVSEDWNVAFSLALFGFASLVLTVARRCGFLRPIAG